MKIAYISTYPPRECGIATFNNNLVKAIAANFKNKSVKDTGFVVALNDSDKLNEYEYPSEVEFIIRQENQNDYIRAAGYINNSTADVCILEHEFGIYGGESGIYVLPLIHRVNKPIVAILHTVLREPTFMQKIAIREIAANAAKIVVMSKKAVGFLKDIYRISPDKIQLIEHGVPDLEILDINPVKKQYPFRDKRVLFTFGLISRGKGLETVVRALPKIISRHPDAMYVILGNTHPGVLRNSGEEYRDHLKRLATELGVQDHLYFINKFVSEEDLFNYLTAIDIYITPYLNEAQITSGTLSYAIGAGAAVVSTPYWHAQELLDDNRGRLFNFKDADGLADIVNDLLGHPEKLKRLKAHAYEYGLKLRWPRIGAEYVNVLTHAITNADYSQKTPRQIIDPEIMPTFSLAHIKRLTDDTGIVQHAKYGIPNLKEGYCLDDNARALIMALMAYQQNKSPEALELLPIYLSYIHYMQLEDGNFRNFLSFDRRYLDDVGSEDSFGRTVWALGYMINCAPNNSYREFAYELFHNSVRHFKSLEHLRGIINTIIGLAHYLKVYPYDEGLLRELNDMTNRVIEAYQAHSSGTWHWFEDKLTYDNAIFPLALLHSCEITGNEQVKSIALKSLAFLDELVLSKGYLCPVGNDGWYYRGGTMPLYDQQAIETMASVLVHLQAYRVAQKTEYLRKMFISYMWFLGENTLRIPLYDHETKGCCDGLQPGGINRNQGAESTLAYMISHLAVLNGFQMEYQYNKSNNSTALTVEQL
ncbi:glycosyltransferase (plasmid) [Pedobacter sp. BS3]|uniref:glycosyltransferase family 4 protein n=1 Tax=Pedobacter sp. BS3 TaxID=2567937 RepID=UPI0011F08713|nr:glycosyltransferase family 4 protein [Pedobacter sp. BS3]TZF86385.1 glycosyltransferase [Pedobacter sp. BS3]